MSDLKRKWKLEPLKTGEYIDRTLISSVVGHKEEYWDPFTLISIDLFWAKAGDNELYQRLSEGKTQIVDVTFSLQENDDD